MTVWMDAHEKGDMRSLVTAACDDVRQSDGFGADYVAGGYAIERKRWQEVAGRMLETDRGLFHQVEKLEAAADVLDLEPALLLEGEIGAPMSHTKLGADRVARYLAGLPVLGVTVMPSTGQRCSARILSRLESGEEPDATRARGSVPDGVEPPRFVLEGVPGVGPSTAGDLLDHFGSAREVAIASRDDLMDVQGIGPSTAETVREAFGGD